MSVRVDTRQAIDGLERLMIAFPTAQMRGAKQAAQSGVDAARSRVHVITGNLRNSIRIIDEVYPRVRFGSDIFYAGIEDSRPGHEYLKPEYNRMQTFYPEMFIQNLRRAF